PSRATSGRGMSSSSGKRATTATGKPGWSWSGSSAPVRKFDKLHSFCFSIQQRDRAGLRATSAERAGVDQAHLVGGAMLVAALVGVAVADEREAPAEHHAIKQVGVVAMCDADPHAVNL